MGKSGRLRNLLCISRRRHSNSTTSSLKNKLSSPKHLQQCSAPPNQYFTGNNEQQNNVMGADQKSIKINTDEIVDKILPPNVDKEFELVDKIVNESAVLPSKMHTNHNETSKPCSLNVQQTTPLIHTRNTASLVRERRVSNARSTMSRRGSTQTNSSSDSSQSSEDSSHNYERLINPGHEIVVTPQKRSTPSLEKVYQKEFARSKGTAVRRNPHQNQRLSSNNTNDESSSSSSVLSHSHLSYRKRNYHLPESQDYQNQSPATVGKRTNDFDTISQSRLQDLLKPELSSSTSSSVERLSLSETSTCSCTECVSPQEQTKDYNWGWVISPQDEVCKRTHRPCCSNYHPSTPGHPYVNNDATHISHRNTRASEIDFTVTQHDGSTLHFTVVGSAVHIQFPQDPSMTSPASVTSSSSVHISKRFPRDASQHSVQASQMHIHDRVTTQNQESLCTMTPNLKGNMQQHQASSENLVRPAKNQARKSDNLESRNSFFLQQQQQQQKHQELQQGASNAIVKKDSISRKVVSHHKPHRGTHYESSPTSSKPRKSPHFQLSMASYAKLVEYQKSNSRQRRPSVPYQTQQGLSKTVSSGGIQEDSRQVTDLCRLAKVLETVEECPWYWGKMTTQEAQRVLRDLEPGSFLLRDSSDPKHLFSLSVKTGQGPTSIRTIYNEGAFRFDYESRSNSNRTNSNSQNSNSASSRSGDHPPYVKKIAPIFTCVVRMVLFYANRLAIEKQKRKSIKSNNKGQCERCAASQKSDNDSNSNSSNLRQDGASSQTCEHRRQEQFICYWESRNGFRHEIPVLLSKPVPKQQSFPTLQRLCRQTLNTSQKLWIHDHVVDELPLPNPLKKYIKKYPYPI